MCPIWPVHYILMYIFAFATLWFLSFHAVGSAAQAMDKWSVTFEPSSLNILEGESATLELRFDKSDLRGQDGQIFIVHEIDDPDIADVTPLALLINRTELENETYPVFQIHGHFLGKAKLKFKLQLEGPAREILSDNVGITVNRVTGTIDLAFTYSVAALVGIIYINMGAALDTDTVIKTLRKPIGPAIGVFSQFVVMPLLGYGLARWLISKAVLQLGLFIAACSPGGGASNIWTLTLGGNLDLSITMTTISTLSAFFMMPLWILTLGSTITEEANLTIPYRNIATFAVSLVVPLIVGICLKRTLPKVAHFLVRILKPFAVFLIVWIVVFAVYTNVYLFRLFTWEIIISGTLLPWLGYLIGGGFAWLFKQEMGDILAIAIETGVQNTGLAIFALRFSLPQPEADLTTVLPVAVAIMTPVVPTILLIVLKVRERFDAKDDKAISKHHSDSASELYQNADGSYNPNGVVIDP